MGIRPKGIETGRGVLVKTKEFEVRRGAGGGNGDDDTAENRWMMRPNEMDPKATEKARKHQPLPTETGVVETINEEVDEEVV